MPLPRLPRALVAARWLCALGGLQAWRNLASPPVDPGIRSGTPGSAALAAHVGGTPLLDTTWGTARSIGRMPADRHGGGFTPAWIER